MSLSESYLKLEFVLLAIERKKCGGAFAGETRVHFREGPDGKAQITLMLDKAPSKDELADRYGAAIVNLTAVEAKFAAEFTTAKAELDAAIANVEGVE